jgi:hypothetical protein
MYEAAATCKDEIARAPVTNLEPPGVTLVGYCYAMRHGMKVQIVTPYRVSHLQRYGVTERVNVTSVCPPLRAVACWRVSMMVKMVVQYNPVVYLRFFTSLLWKNPEHRFTLCFGFSLDKWPLHAELPGRCATLPPDGRLFSSVALISEQLHYDDTARHDVTTACLRLKGWTVQEEHCWTAWPWR